MANVIRNVDRDQASDKSQRQALRSCTTRTITLLVPRRPPRFVPASFPPAVML
jgi:hypothetical protein